MSKPVEKSFNVVLAGVGGQGVILAATILANAAVRAGLSARVGQTFTAAQRIGSVSAHVRLGRVIHSPLIGVGDADVILGLEFLEGLRYLNYLKRGGLLIVNTHIFPPRQIMLGQSKYPDPKEVEDIVVKRFSAKVIKVNATEVAKSIGSSLLTNTVMLGVLSRVSGFPIDHRYLVESIRERSPSKYVELNIKAFNTGRKLIPQL